MNKNMTEIERKFLVKFKEIPEFSNSFEIIQGYLVKNEKGTVRIRIETELLGQPKAYLMSKTKIDDMTNDETVDEITVHNALELIEKFCVKVIKKCRYIIMVGEKKWEIDFFKEPNNGLVLAEIELNSADEQFQIPDWVEREVTGESAYYNANM